MSLGVGATSVPRGILNPMTSSRRGSIAFVAHPVFQTHGKVHKIVLFHRHPLVAIEKDAVAFQDVIELLLGGITDHGARSARRHRKLAIAGNSLQLPGLGISHTESRTVFHPGGAGGEVVGSRLDVRQVAMEKSGVGRQQDGAGSQSQSNGLKEVHKSSLSLHVGRRSPATKCPEPRLPDIGYS